MAQKKRLDAQNTSQKTSAPHKVWFLKNHEKPQKNYNFWPFFRFFIIKGVGGSKNYPTWKKKSKKFLNINTIPGGKMEQENGW